MKECIFFSAGHHIRFRIIAKKESTGFSLSPHLKHRPPRNNPFRTAGDQLFNPLSVTFYIDFSPFRPPDPFFALFSRAPSHRPPSPPPPPPGRFISRHENICFCPCFAAACLAFLLSSSFYPPSFLLQHVSVPTDRGKKKKKKKYRISAIRSFDREKDEWTNFCFFFFFDHFPSLIPSVKFARLA